MNFKPSIFRLTALALGVAASLVACGDSNNDAALLRQSVNASTGGTFDVSGQGVRVVVPAGALAANASSRYARLPTAPCPIPAISSAAI